jgi:hypothetical protein
MGYGKYDSSSGSVTFTGQVFPKTNRDGGASCLTAGDTFKFGPFNNGELVVFYLDPNGASSSRFWSYLDPPGLVNPDTSVCGAPSGCTHGSWAYIANDDITLFGFEDSSLGDADYNDLMFFLQVEGGATFNEVPTYGGGTILVCNTATAVSDSSYAELNCTQWGLLEATTSSSCLTYMSIPTGWTWALDSDASAHIAISSLASKWSYSEASCFLLASNDSYTGGVGYHSDGSPCLTSEYNIQTILNGTKLCYNAACTSRFVLKGSYLGVDCSSTDRCSLTTSGSVLAYEPSSGSSSVVVYPTSYSVYLKAGSGSVSVSTSVQLTGGSSSTQNIDVLVVADFTSASSSSQIANIKSSWANIASGFSTEKLNPQFAFVNYRRTSSSAYTLTTDYTFRSSVEALDSSQFPTSSSTSCPTASNNPMHTAVAELITTRYSQFNWREDNSFHLVWIHSACPIADTSVLYNAVISSGVVPIITYSGSSSSLPTGYSLSNSPPLAKSYKASSNWASPFVYASSTASTPKGAGSMKSLVTSLVAYASSGNTDFVSGLTTTVNTDAASTGLGTTSYTIAWPSGLAVDNSASYSTVVRVMGRTTTTFRISFNRLPSIPNVSYSFVGSQSQTIVLSPTDPDGNLINIAISTYPSQGVLYTTDGVQITDSNPLATGIYTFVYKPNQYASGSDSVVVAAGDGCASTTGTVSLSITYANTAPVAKDIVINMDEDSTATGTNGQIDFTNYISDEDNSHGQSQTLTVRLVSNPSPSDKGSLVTYSGSTAVSIGSLSTKVLKFVLASPRSGYGNVTFTYQVSDNTNQGNDLSNVATVTVVIKHINHAPILSIPNTKYTVKVSSATDTVISGSITDYDYSTDKVNLYVLSSNLTNFQIAADATVGSGAIYPAKLYSSNLTSTTSNFAISNLLWKQPTVNGETERVTFIAQDSTGTWSNSVDVILQTADANPPTWVSKPINTSNPSAFSMTQGDTLSNLYFSATDEDSTQWQTLIFTLTSAPSNGIVRVRPISTGSTSTLILSTKLGNANNASYVGLAASSSVSYFSIDYIPSSSFVGTDSFSFIVTDSDGISSSDVATVTVNVARKLLPPQCANITIRTLEQVGGSAAIAVASQNIPANSVLLQLESFNFPGTLTLSTSASWSIGTNTSATSSSSITVTATSQFGFFSTDPSTTPTGNFTYVPIEPATNLVGTPCTGYVYVTHVNHAPTSTNQVDTVKKRTPLKVTLSASDSDADDIPSTISASFTAINPSSQGTFWFDEAMSLPLTTATLSTRTLTDRTFWYISETAYSTSNTPLARYTFVVTDQHGLQSSSSYSGSITVTPAGDVPVPATLETSTYQETPVPMSLAVGATTETGSTPTVRITSLPEFGTFAVCAADGVCSLVYSAPVDVGSTAGRVIFVPRDYDWGDNFTSFDFTLTDPESNAIGTYTMVINVIHVNKKPSITAANFLTTAQSTSGIVINESEWRSFDWIVSDVDSLPSTLTTSLRIAFYTSQGFNIYSCTYATGHWDTQNCTFNSETDTPFAARADFAKNAQKIISSFEVVTADCETFDDLKLRYGVASDNCQAHFKMVFAPTPSAYYTPYVSITFVGVDDNDAESSSISALIFVKSINTAPTVWSPSIVISGQGISNPFILDTSTDSSTYNNPVSVGDVDSNGNIELLTIKVVDGYTGNLVWPSTAACSADSSIAQTWNCLDRIDGFNQWLVDLRFEVTSGDRADITFTMNDLGYSSDYSPSPNLTATSTTSIRLTAAATAPSGNSSTLAIAVGVSAAAGLALLGALGFFLRRAVAPPSDDYFSAATSPLSAAPQSPLYAPQNVEHTSALYKAKT